MCSNRMNLENRMLSESQTQKATNCVIPFIRTAQNRQSHRDRMYTGDGWGRKKMGTDCLMGKGFSLGAMTMFWSWRNWLHSFVGVLCATDLQSFKWLILYYVHFSSIKKKNPVGQPGMHVINISLIILIYTNDHRLENINEKNILSLQEEQKTQNTQE